MQKCLQVERVSLSMLVQPLCRCTVQSCDCAQLRYFSSSEAVQINDLGVLSSCRQPFPVLCIPSAAVRSGSKNNQYLVGPQAAQDEAQGVQ
ncbi:hypothetical protein ADK75_03910 [Streptomyces virginiae]|uniref:Uncharacterized protein n=1 Tax=Streptomyces virginiae TaxID=1961 RepID=A0A0L8N4H6_STRVG|nr:hypothetical protein ADK75_03910 [Streptomyces virginiae]